MSGLHATVPLSPIGRLTLASSDRGPNGFLWAGPPSGQLARGLWLVRFRNLAAAVAAVAAKPNKFRIIYMITGHPPAGFGEIPPLMVNKA
jgi:hypothetical protein